MYVQSVSNAQHLHMILSPIRNSNLLLLMFAVFLRLGLLLPLSPLTTGLSVYLLQNLLALKIWLQLFANITVIVSPGNVQYC